MFDTPPFLMDGTTADAETIRRAVGSLLNPAGGIVTPGDLTVSAQTTPNMSVQIATGGIWVPGTNTPTQGPYYGYNKAAITQPITTANGSAARVDTIAIQAQDAYYNGQGTPKDLVPAYILGTPTAGATKANLQGIGSLPACSLAIAYVEVDAGATSITNTNILNVAYPLCTNGSSVTATDTAGNQTTQSQSGLPMTGNLVTLVCSGAPLKITFSALASNNTNGGTINSGLAIDGNSVGTLGSASPAAAGNFGSIGFVYPYTPTPGVHTFQPVWAVNEGTGTLYCNAGTPASILVETLG